MTACPHCGGTGFARDADVELAADAMVISLRSSCEITGKDILVGDRVDEATAAWLLNRAVKTLRDWRYTHRPIDFSKPGGRVIYHLRDIARFIVESRSDDEK